MPRFPALLNSIPPTAWSCFGSCEYLEHIGRTIGRGCCGFANDPRCSANSAFGSSDRTAAPVFDGGIPGFHRGGGPSCKACTSRVIREPR